jgi:alpha-D-ribose 1-methylphosphonate 5-triphosphate synthase subunit PhnH
LIDLETSYYTSDSALRKQLVHLGAAFNSPEQARYQFYPVMNRDALDQISHAPVGSYASPDDSATLVIGCTLGSGILLELEGPGIKTQTCIRVDGIPGEFWKLRKEKCMYPMGWDIFLVSDNRIVGLPRTTRLEVK